jgi:hypothetical protein
MKKPDFLTMCGITYARTENLLVETLFQPEGTASGFFHIAKNGILFSDLQGNPFAFLVANRHDERFFVSCSRSKPDGGLIRYMFSTCTIDEKRLNLPDGYTDRLNLARDTWEWIQSEITRLNPSAA